MVRLVLTMFDCLGFVSEVNIALMDRRLPEERLSRTEEGEDTHQRVEEMRDQRWRRENKEKTQRL